MRRTDDVFFFTLIDFLLQIFFFGLLLFVVGQSLQKDKCWRRYEIDQVRRSRTGQAQHPDWPWGYRVGVTGSGLPSCKRSADAVGYHDG
jgi:hypothetical protein